MPGPVLGVASQIHFDGGRQINTLIIVLMSGSGKCYKEIVME